MRTERIIKERERLGMNQSQFANAVGVSKQIMSAYENGFKNPSAPVIAKMAQVLNCTTDYLIGVDRDQA